MSFNAWSEFSCPDECERYGCKEPDLHISISLVDLMTISLITGKKSLDLFERDCKIGFDPMNDGEPWLGWISIELRKPCSFLDEKECSIYPGRPIACALFPEYNFMVENRDSLLKKDIFREFPCIQNPCFIPPQRKKMLQKLLDMFRKEKFLSDFYLFGISPFVLDLKSVAGEGLEGIHISEDGMARIPHHQIESLISRRLREGEYLDEWKAKIEELDRLGGVNRLTEMSCWTDQMAGQGWTSFGISYQFDGNRLQPVHLHRNFPPIGGGKIIKKQP